jgi:hypothetical protein
MPGLESVRVPSRSKNRVRADMGQARLSRAA